MRNWGGNIVFGTDTLYEPASVAELQELVSRTPQLRPLGTRHSFSRIADTTGALISVRRLVHPIEIDGEGQTVRAAAGTRYAELAAALDGHGWALANLGSLPHISVAGACATGTHGSGDRNTCLAASVLGIEFVRGDGSLIRLGAAEPTFPGAVVALGALGVVTDLTLAIEPTYQVRQDVWLDVPLSKVLGRFAEIMGAGYSVSMFTTLSSRRVVDQIWVKSRTDESVADGREWGATAADSAHHPISGQDPASTTQQLGVPGPWHKRLPHFRPEFAPSVGTEQQSEYLLPREHGPAALEAIASLDVAAALQVCEIRTVAADDLWLSPCTGRETVAVHFTWIDDDAVAQPAVAAIETTLEQFDPRPHWGKVFLADPRPRYSRLADFRTLAATHDPERRFANAFLNTYVYD